MCIPRHQISIAIRDHKLLSEIIKKLWYSKTSSLSIFYLHMAEITNTNLCANIGLLFLNQLMGIMLWCQSKGCWSYEWQQFCRCQTKRASLRCFGISVHWTSAAWSHNCTWDAGIDTSALISATDLTGTRYNNYNVDWRKLIRFI